MSQKSQKTNGRTRLRPRLVKKFSKPSLCQQQFAAECNINTIMKKYKKTGIIEHVNRYKAEYNNFIGYPDYHEAQNQILAAHEMFMTLPSSIRERFSNNAESFLAFAQNTDNIDEMRSLGLAEPKRPEGYVETKPLTPEPTSGLTPDKAPAT